MRTNQKARGQAVRIVAVGGGTGLSMVLRGLKDYVARRKTDQLRRPIADLAALVAVTDDGGSSGRLRRDYRIQPPGDIRNCMVALSKDEALLGKLFQYRFPCGRGLRGHSFGNLFLAALTNVTGDFNEAVRLSGQVLAIRGRIFPATNENVTLEAELEDGTTVAGETRISQSHKRIRHVRLVPGKVRPLPEVLEAIRDADLLLVGPGSLYTSIIPPLLVDGIVKAMERTQATRVYIANLMTQPGETTSYSLADHIQAIYDHTRPGLFDTVVINDTPLSPRLLRRYHAAGAEPVRVDLDRIERLGLAYVIGDLLEENGLVRHDADRLTRVLLEEFIETPSRR